MTKSKAYIDKVYTKSDKGTKPTLLKFQNGSLAAINKETTLFCKMEHNKHKGALVVANNNIYHGLFHETANDDLTDSYICIRNRSTNKVRIIPIEQVSLQNHIYKVIDKTRVVRESEETNKNTLLKKFGGRKAATYANNAEKIKINIDVLKDELDSTINDISLNEEDDVASGEEYMNLLRPKYNAEARTVQEIFNINDVVSKELLDRLEEEAKVVSTTNVEDLPINSEYLKEQIKKIQHETPSAVGNLRIKLFLYMDALANLIKSRSRNLNTMQLSNITEKVENDIRERFSDPRAKKMLRTKLSTEKALCFYIVLALLTTDDYGININILVQELGAPKQKVTKFAHVVFAKRKMRSEIINFTLPSKIPKISNIRRRMTK